MPRHLGDPLTGLIHGADSTGVRKKLGELLGWFHESQRLAGPVVQALGDAGQILSGVSGQVGAFGQVPAQQPVGVFVRSALPGVIGLIIWARIDDQRQRSFVTGYPGRPPGFQGYEDIRGSMHAGRRQRVADGG
jgi:hypothetical protein